MAQLPPGFVFGTATSAYQIEGGRHEGGKGDSIWDRFSDLGRLADRGDVACDHYHRHAEDVALLAGLGVDAYRFSIAWSRVIPDGDGAVNPEGLDFYDRLVDELLAAGIAPWPTLYHWDLPVELQERGGWTERRTAAAFARYAGVVADRLGDRVRHWITHNEPWVATFLGHVDGVFAPGTTSWPDGLAAGHHILLSHGMAVDQIRSQAPGAEIGIALDCRPSRPATPSPADAAADRHFDGYRNRWFFDPVFGKGYPEHMVAAYRDRGRLPSGHPVLARPDDHDLIARPIDFVGLNYYTSIVVSAGDEEHEPSETMPDPPEGFTEMGWEITPSALTAFLERIDTDYGHPTVIVTENGASYSDGPDDTGRIRDDRRIAYLDAHIQAVETAVARGARVGGYFVWSLLDNLEWVAGFSQRFGLVWVDHHTGTRTPKDSYDWYRRRIASNR
jgi:beta-glucosidase